MLGGGQRQLELDLGGTGSGELRASAVRLRNGAYDGEAEARAAGLGSGRDKAAEEVVLYVLRDGPGAHHPHRDALAFATHDEPRRLLRFAVHDGVVDQIVDGSREPVGLAAHDRIGIDTELDDGTAIFGR